MNQIKQPTPWFLRAVGDPALSLGGRWQRHFVRAVAALGAGGSTIPFGDNGDVFRALAATRTHEHDVHSPCP